MTAKEMTDNSPQRSCGTEAERLFISFSTFVLIYVKNIFLDVPLSLAVIISRVRNKLFSIYQCHSV
jgi:hypothetical protein